MPAYKVDDIVFTQETEDPYRVGALTPWRVSGVDAERKIYLCNLYDFVERTDFKSLGPFGEVRKVFKFDSLLLPPVEVRCAFLCQLQPLLTPPHIVADSPVFGRLK
jgi:hypothetical protein